MDYGQGGCSQRCFTNTPARDSKPLQKCDAWIQLLMKWLVEVSAIHQLPVQRYSEVFELEKGRQAFVVVGDFQFTFTILVVDVDDCRHRFCSAELQLPHLEQWFSTTVTRAACGTQEPAALWHPKKTCSTAATCGTAAPAALRHPALRHPACGTQEPFVRPSAVFWNI